MLRRVFHKPGSDHDQKRQLYQNSTRFKRTKRSNTQKQISNAKH